MKVELFDDHPNFVQKTADSRARETELKLAPAKKCGTKDGGGELAESLAESLARLGKKLPISAQDCLREARGRVLRSLLSCAGEVTGYSVAHVSVLLSVTERTVRNWIVETGLGMLYFGPASSARILYRGVVTGIATDLTGSRSIGPIRTEWCADYVQAVKESRMIWHSYRISDGNIEVEIKKVIDD